MSTFAYRDQENLVHAHQQAAAAKPLNQGVRGLAPKTPGNNGSKAGINARTARRNQDENMFIGGGKTVKGNKAAFVTPMAQRERAPLGAKTTNMKANAFKTPMPKPGDYALQKTQKRTTSARKHKLKVHQPEVASAEPNTHSDDDDEEPEIEYCPPKITPLPDLPDLCFSPDYKFPRFEGPDRFAGALSFYLDDIDPIGEDGLRKSERAHAERQRVWEEESDRMLAESAMKGCQLTDDDLRWYGIEPVNSAATAEQSGSRTAKITQQPRSTSSRTAASSLATRAQPSYAAPTAAAKARKAAVFPSSRNMAPGAAASRTTIGYSAGRKVSSTLKQYKDAPAKAERKPSGPVTTLNDLLDDFSFGDDYDDDEDDLPWKKVEDIIIPGIDDVKDFRLEMPGEL